MAEFDWDEILVSKDPDNKEVSVNFTAVDGTPYPGSPASELCVRVYSNETFTHITGSAHWVWLELTAAPDRYVKVRLDFDSGNGIGEPSPSPQYAEFYPGDDRTLQFSLSAGVADDLLNSSNYRATASIAGSSCAVSQATVEFVRDAIPPDPDPDEPTEDTGDPIPGDNPECAPHSCDALTEPDFIEANRRIALFINNPTIAENTQLLNFEGDPIDTTVFPGGFNSFSPYGPMVTGGPCTLNNILKATGVSVVFRDGTPGNFVTGNQRIAADNPNATFGINATPRSNSGFTSTSGEVKFWWYPYTSDPDVLTSGRLSLALWDGAYRIYADGGLQQTFAAPQGFYIDPQAGQMYFDNGMRMAYDPTKWWLPITYYYETTMYIYQEENTGQFPGFPLGPVDIVQNDYRATVTYDDQNIVELKPLTEIYKCVETTGFKEDDGNDSFATRWAIPTNTALVGYVRDPTSEDSVSRHFQAYMIPPYCERIP